MFCFDFQPFGGFDLFVTGRRHFLSSERLLSFNNVMITLTSARSSARTVELASGFSRRCPYVYVPKSQKEAKHLLPSAQRAPHRRLTKRLLKVSRLTRSTGASTSGMWAALQTARRTRQQTSTTPRTFLILLAI